MLITDYHMHSEFSPDSDTPMETIAKKSVEMGLKEIAITDHMEFTKAFTPIDYTKYKKELNRVRNLYQDKLTIKFGVEIGLSLNHAKEINDLVASHDFDFVIGSVHDVEGLEFHLGDYFANKTKDEAYTQYFTFLLDCIKEFDCFCVSGHLDYIFRYATYEDNSIDYDKFAPLIDEILINLIKKDKGLELNAAGYKIREFPYPTVDVLKRYKELGGKIITVGSDAHFPEWIAFNFDKALRDLKSAGFEYITTFKNMKPEFIKLQ